MRPREKAREKKRKVAKGREVFSSTPVRDSRAQTVWGTDKSSEKSFYRSHEGTRDMEREGNGEKEKRDYLLIAQLHG